MNPAIYLSCLVVVVGSLAWTASAQDFEADRRRLIGVYKDASPGSISDLNVYFLVNFLDKHGDQVELTPEQRERAANAVRQYKEERASQPLVDGVPPRSVRALLVQMGIELASAGIKKATAKD